MKAEKQWQEGTSLKFNFCTDEVVSKSSTAAAVKQVLRRSMLGWGVPEAVRTDNGKDYVSDEVDSLLCDLEIIHEICIPVTDGAPV